MNPTVRTFALIGLTVIILLSLHYLPPITIGGKELRRVNMLSDLFPDTTRRSAALPVVPLPQVAQTALPSMAADSLAAADSLVAVQPDSLYPEGVAPIIDYAVAGEDVGMDHFFSQLAAADRLSRPVRIAYFGDSFIEGDILTGDLRELFQDDFGGSGVGWVDCGSQVNGFRQTVSHQFSGLDMHDAMSHPYRSELAGIAQRYFVPESQAVVTMSGTRHKKHLDGWAQSTLFLKTADSLLVGVTLNGDTTLVDSIGGADEVQAVTHRGDSVRLRKVSYAFRHAPAGTLLYGVAHESARGVVVDNFSLRGSSGVPIAAVPMATLRRFAQLRDYDLIVLHFGLNMVSDDNDEGAYLSYVRNMGRAIDHLRAAYPRSSILIVGVPDRDQRSAEGLTTMEGVTMMNAYQQLMASEHHVAFYNLFQAMGGPGSMNALVEKGMANKDYTHINSAGGRHIARIIYDSLMAAYQLYLERSSQ